MNSISKLSIVLIGITLLFPFQTLGKTEVLKLLIWGGYGPEAFARKFERDIERKYGRKIRLDFSLAGSHDDFFDPIRSGSVDVIAISHHTFKDERYNYIANKLVLPFDLDRIPNHSHLIPDLKKADYHTADGNVYGIPVANGPYGLAYSSKKVTSPPQSWSILWDSAYKKDYIIGAQEYLYNINITALVMGYSRDDINDYDRLNNAAFKAKLRLLAVNAHSFWVGVDQPRDLQGLSLAATWGDSLVALNRKGGKWNMANPKEGTLWWIDDYALTWVLAKKPFLKTVAEEWINKTLTSDFQVDHLVREVGIYPVTTNILSDLTEQEKKRIQISRMPGKFMENHILQETYTQRDRNGLRLLWDEAMQGMESKIIAK